MTTTTPRDPWPLPEPTRARRAIVVADVVESVRLMQDDEAGFIERWRRFVHLVRSELLPRHGGRMVKSLGDGMLLEFEHAGQAIHASLEMQRLCGTLNDGATQRGFQLRIGAHIAEVVRDELDVYGVGVNHAARLAQLARPGDVCVSADLRDAITPDVDADLEDLGECFLKHVDQPVRAYRTSAPQAVGTPLPAPQDPRPTIAVLPFSGDAPEGVCAELFTDTVIASLSRTPTFNVISRLSSRCLRGREQALTLARALLGADFVVSGHLQREGERYILVAELADTRREAVVWAHSGTERVADLLAARSDLADAVVEGVTQAVVAATLQRLAGHPIPSLETFALLLGGATLLHRQSRADFERAHDLLQGAAERVPRHPAPQAWLAKWHVLRAQQGWVTDPARTAIEAADCARRALDADPADSLALSMDALVHVHFTRDLERADRLYRRAIEANPNDALAWLHKGMLHAFRGEGDAGVTDTERAIALSPLDPMRYYFDSLGASAAATAARYERAIELAQRSLRANCLHTSTLRVLAISQMLLGRGDEARATVRRLLSLEPAFTVGRFRARAPGAAFEVGQRFAEALREAGVPE